MLSLFEALWGIGLIVGWQFVLRVDSGFYMPWRTDSTFLRLIFLNGK